MLFSRNWSDHPLRNGLWLLALNLSLMVLFLLTFAATAYFVARMDYLAPLLPLVILGFGILSLNCWYQVGRGLPPRLSARQVALPMLVGFSPLVVPTLYFLFADSADQHCGEILLAPMGVLAGLAATLALRMGYWRGPVRQPTASPPSPAH
ncbi:MAG: hypothetical protein IT369_03860 [Candidatus Latescibacteria bacterium]|nr:hypothetical protein [Candidatus Latescibacterota bacterium]